MGHKKVIDGKKSVDKVDNESPRIWAGVTSGEVQISIPKAIVIGVLNAFRRLMIKGESRTRAAVREIRVNIFNPHKARNIIEFEPAVAEWESNVVKLEPHDLEGQFNMSDVDGLDTYCQLFPPLDVLFTPEQILKHLTT